jgi:integrase
MNNREFNFTKSALEALQPGAGKDRYRDSKTRGLILVVRAGGSKVFYLYRNVGGKPLEMKIGPFPDLSVENARNMAAELNTTIAKNEDPRKSAKVVKEITLGELFTWWLDSHAKSKRPFSWETDEQAFKNHMQTLAPRNLSTLTKSDFRKLHQAIGETGKKRMANKVMQLIRGVYAHAIDYDEFKGDNPIAGMDWYPEFGRERRIMPEEVKAFFAAVLTEPSDNVRDYVLLSLFTGARQANTLAMRWDQIDYNARTWTIPRTKNGRSLVVPLQGEEMDILRAREADAKTDWVFPGFGKKGHMVYPQTGWRRICERASLKDLHLHDLRRSLGSWMVDTGASLPIIGKTLGHQSQAATAIYARLSLDPVREAKAKAIGALLKAADA